MSHPASATFALHRRLRHHEFLHIRRPPKLRLRTECGTLWVTIDGEPLDIEIEAGHSRDFDGRAPITIGTLGGDAVFTATPHGPRRARLRDGWLALWASLGLPALRLRAGKPREVLS